MSVQDDLLHALRTWQRLPSKALTDRLGISRAALMRAVHGLGPAVISGGKACCAGTSPLKTPTCCK